jgi:hypothetical protein
MQIQNTTGFVGINTTAPASRLDVTAATETAVNATSAIPSASVGSIYATNTAGPTAALATSNNGIYAHSVATNGAAVFGDNNTSNTVGYAGFFAGRVHVNGTLTKSAGAFKIDHPLDPANKYLVHSFVESPDMMNIYNGNVVTDGSGKAVVTLPDYFEALNMEFRYQLTVIGTFAQAIISRKVQNNQFEIATSLPNVEVSWMVTGVRHDAYASMSRIPNAVEKEPANRGKYLNPEAFNLPASLGIAYDGQADRGSSPTQIAPVAQKPQDPASRSGGSLDPVPAPKVLSAPVDNTGSVGPVYAPKPVTKPVDKTGSVADTPAEKR